MTRETDAVHNKLARQVGGAIACLLAAALLLGLTACGGGQAKPPEEEPPVAADEPARPDPEKQSASQVPTPTPEPAPAVPVEPDDDEHDGFPEPEEIDDPQPDELHEFTQEEFDQVVSDVLETIIKEDMTPMEQAKAVFSYVHNNIRYTGKADKSDWMNGAYVGLTTLKGDCFTYYAVSRALLTALEIDNLEVQRVGGKTQHFWNLVNCGDGWYHFDACPRSIKMPSFNSFMVTGEQVAAFTAMAGRNYYDFDGSLLPERATEIVTKTRPIPRPPEEPEEETEPGETEEPTEGLEEPILPPEENQEAEGGTVPAPEEGAPLTEPADPGEAPVEGENGEPAVWEEPPAEEWEDPSLDDGGGETVGEAEPEYEEGTEAA